MLLLSEKTLIFTADFAVALHVLTYDYTQNINLKLLTSNENHSFSPQKVYNIPLYSKVSHARRAKFTTIIVKSFYHNEKYLLPKNGGKYCYDGRKYCIPGDPATITMASFVCLYVTLNKLLIGQVQSKNVHGLLELYMTYLCPFIEFYMWEFIWQIC